MILKDVSKNIRFCIIFSSWPASKEDCFVCLSVCWGVSSCPQKQFRFISRLSDSQQEMWICKRASLVTRSGCGSSTSLAYNRSLDTINMRMISMVRKSMTMIMMMTYFLRNKLCNFEVEVKVQRVVANQLMPKPSSGAHHILRRVYKPISVSQRLLFE